MSREGVVSRRTATRYIEAAKTIGLDPSAELTDEAVREVAARVQTRPATAISDPRQVLATQRVRIEKWLAEGRPLTPVRVHELLGRDGIAVSYRAPSLIRAAVTRLHHPAPTSSHPPGTSLGRAAGAADGDFA